jgi:hypothetical protein
VVFIPPFEHEELRHVICAATSAIKMFAIISIVSRGIPLLGIETLLDQATHLHLAAFPTYVISGFTVDDYIISTAAKTYYTLSLSSHLKPTKDIANDRFPLLCL